LRFLYVETRNQANFTTFESIMRAIQFIFIPIILFSCKIESEENAQNRKINNIRVFIDFGNALKAAAEDDKNIFVICDSPYRGCCKKETEKIFDYLNEHQEILKKYHILYLNLDEQKVDKRQSTREQFIALNGLITSYYFFTIDKNARVLKQRDWEIETNLALDKIFEK